MTFAPRLEPYTADDLRALPSGASLLGGCLLLDTSLSVDEVVTAYPDAPNVELLGGRLVVSPWPSFQHQRMVMQIARWIEDQARSTGIAVPGANVVLGDGTLVVPDVLLVRPGDYGVWLDAADVLLAVEVLSPSSRAYDLDQKLAAYERAGVSLWVVDPEDRSVRAFGPPAPFDRADLHAVL